MAAQTNARNILLGSGTRTADNVKSVSLSADKLAFTYDSSGTLSPLTGQVVTFTATRVRTSEALSWSTVPAVTLYNAATGGSVATTESTVYLRAIDFAAYNSVQVTAKVIDGSVLTSSLNVLKQQTGAKGVDGSPGSKSITVSIFQWSSNAITAVASTNFNYNWGTGTVSAVPGGWATSAPASTTTGQTLYQANLVITDIATATVTGSNWSGATFGSIGYRQDGTIGLTGPGHRTAYVVTTNPVVPLTPTAGIGDTAPTSSVTNLDNSLASWSYTATSTLASGQYMYQTDGIYTTGANVAWGNPYLSNLKVGSLSALAVDTGNLTVGTSGSIKTYGKGYGEAGGFFMGNDLGTNKFSIGDKLTYNGTTFKVGGITISSTGALGGIGTGSGTVVDNTKVTEKLTSDNLFTGNLVNFSYQSGNAGISTVVSSPTEYADPRGGKSAVVIKLPAQPSFLTYDIFQPGEGRAAEWYTVTAKIFVVAGMSIVFSATDMVTWDSSEMAIASTTSTSPVWVTVRIRQYIAANRGFNVVFGAYFKGGTTSSTITDGVAIADLAVYADGYGGDMNATNGAPAGTPVGGSTAEAVAATQEAYSSQYRVIDLPASVGYTRDTFFPVVLTAGVGYAASYFDVVVSRPNIHEDENGLGSYTCHIWARGSAWGNTPGAIVEIDQVTGYGPYNWGVGDVVTGIGTNASIVLMLRGGMKHHISVSQPIGPYTVQVYGFSGFPDPEVGTIYPTTAAPLSAYLNKAYCPAAPVDWNASIGGRPPDSALLNSYVATGQNLIPNSDQKSVITWRRADGGIGASFVWDLWYASRIWGDVYTLLGSTTKNVFLRQSNIGSGGDTGVATDIYPLGAWTAANSIPVSAGKRYIFSCYVQTHRCNFLVGAYFFNSADSYLGEMASATLSGTNDRADTLDAYVRGFAVGTAPANTAYVRLYVRKFNTLAGHSDSYIWLAAPQFEEVAANVTGPSSYRAGSINALLAGAQNALSGGTSLITGSLEVNSSGVRTGGYGVGITEEGIAAYNSAGIATFSLNGSTGDANYAGTLRVGNSPAISGTSMTGSGAVINNTGTFALGSMTSNITGDSNGIRINGPVVISSNLAPSVGIGGANLLYNSSFENKTNTWDSWAQYTNISSTASSGPARGGTAVSVLANQNGSSGHWAFGISSIIAGGWKANTVYMVSFWAACAGSRSGKQMWLNWNTQPAHQESILNPGLTADWQRYIFRVTWGASAESSGLYITSVDANTVVTGDILYFDDVQVEEGNVATAWKEGFIDSVSTNRKITNTNVSAYIDSAAIGYAQVGELKAQNIEAGAVTAIKIQAGAVTAQKIDITAGNTTERVVINSNQIIVYDSANVQRVKIGLL